MRWLHVKLKNILVHIRIPETPADLFVSQAIDAVRKARVSCTAIVLLNNDKVCWKRKINCARDGCTAHVLYHHLSLLLG